MGRSRSRDVAAEVTALTGVVLAGGHSRRMGVDKAGLTLGDQTLLERAVSCLRAICDEVLVASGDGRRLAGPWRQVADVQADAGPLGGLVAALEAARTPLVAALAVDALSPSQELLMFLAQRWDGRSWAVVPRAAGRLEPL
ncbi:MAG TPA: molybdenum cofactor guanylyltransferase, partial [Nitriliruptorales bacterium]